MSLIGYIISLLFTGLIVGAIARLLLPGRDPMSIPQTIGIGIAGSLIAGLIYRVISDGKAQGGGIILAVVVTVGLVYLVRRSRAGKAGHAGHGVGSAR